MLVLIVSDKVIVLVWLVDVKLSKFDVELSRLEFELIDVIVSISETKGSLVLETLLNVSVKKGLENVEDFVVISVYNVSLFIKV